MKKESSLSYRKNVKNEIMNQARVGNFDTNPLLAIPHQIVCNVCGHAQKISYLDNLKSGLFELGKTTMVEVTPAAPTIFGFSYFQEKMTPIIISTKCARCETELSCIPSTVEYLLFTTRRRQKLERMYV